MTELDPIRWLEAWYAAQCDGDWEHAQGVKIDTLDNPGWSVAVSLKGTALESREFEAIDESGDDTDWLVCRIESKDPAIGPRFVGAGDPSKLGAIVARFRSWAESD